MSCMAARLAVPCVAMKHCIALVGLSGSGKSTVGPLLAQLRGWRFVDTDQLVVAAAGQSIAEIFRTRGEAAFRDLEAQALEQACQPRTVVATGGGCIEQPRNRALLTARANVVWLAARPASLVVRLAAATDRPLLGGDLAARLAEQATRRTPLYAELADWVVAVDQLEPQRIVMEIERGLATNLPGDLQVTTPGGSYPVIVGPGVYDQLPALLAQLGLTRRAWLVSDTAVLPHYGARITALLDTAGIPSAALAIPAGEAHKNMTTLGLVHDWLLGGAVERGDVVLALGGGVVGDLAGFAASTVLRGIAVVQLPTTVLAMVDSAIGGKTGVDHAAGKNLIGTFHQPRVVLADTTVLTTLPAAERTAGWAEAIKHGVIGDAALFDDLVAHADDLAALREPRLSDLLRRAAGFKAGIVSGDEREQGQRILLNYGHTLGHALEAWSDYRIRHGEAVAIGMMAAATIAERLDLLDSSAVARQAEVLTRFGLPTRFPAAVTAAALLARIGSDKKVRDQQVQWVLPTAIGAMTVRRAVPAALVSAVIDDLRG